jgi:hypothetical protein
VANPVTAQELSDDWALGPPAINSELPVNADFPWDVFDSAAYFEHNYSSLRPDDEVIIEIVGDFFHANEQRRLRPQAIDVGAGANLYPALTMVPFAAELTLCERAFSNRQWLEAEILTPHPSWWRFWSHLNTGRAAYQPIKNPFDLLGRRAQVTKGNIFSLRPGRYDIGTMFFVAESITTRHSEFVRATRSFVGSLRVRAPFAAAFMRHSSGYQVGNRSFPACWVDEEDVRSALAPLASGVTIRTVESNDLRDGYCGMMVATGFKKA